MPCELHLAFTNSILQCFFIFSKNNATLRSMHVPSQRYKPVLVQLTISRTSRALLFRLRWSHKERVKYYVLLPEWYESHLSREDLLTQ